MYGLLMAAVLVLTVAGAGRARAADGDTVSDGVYVQGTDVGGLTRSQMKQAIDDRVKELGSQTLTVSVGESSASCSLQSLGLTWTNTQILDEIMTLGTTGNIIRRYKDQKDIQAQTVEYTLDFAADEEKVRAFVSECSAFNTDPVNATIYVTDQLTPGINGGTYGITLMEDESVAQIIEAVEGWNGSDELTMALTVDHVRPSVSYDDLAVITDVLGTATTDYSASTAARAVNVENGCRKINGTLLWPGESFSVTAAVSPFTAENGYEQAPSYEENRVVDSYGGGICQVSTTLYNAVLKAELEVTARSNHTMAVSYVPLSKDAAIAEGIMDMSFVNTLSDPVYIIGYTSGGTITFIIYGHETRPSNRTLEFESRTLSTIEPTETMLYADMSQPVGSIRQVQSQHTGYTAELWKNIYIDGVLTDSVKINYSYYYAVGTIYNIGVATTNNALATAMYTAIASNSLTQVQTVIANASSYTTPTESETQAETQPESAAEQAPEQAPEQAAETTAETVADTAAPAAGEDVIVMDGG